MIRHVRLYLKNRIWLYVSCHSQHHGSSRDEICGAPQQMLLRSSENPLLGKIWLELDTPLRGKSPKTAAEQSLISTSTPDLNIYGGACQYIYVLITYY